MVVIGNNLLLIETPTAIQRAVDRRHQPLRGATKIALKVAAALDRHKMPKHFDLTIAADRLTVTRKTEAIHPRQCRHRRSSAPSAR